MYESFQELSSDSDAVTLTIGKKDIKRGTKRLEGMLSVYYTEKTREFTTVDDAISGTSYQAYKLPENYKKFTECYVTVGTTQYPMELIQSNDLWRQINASTTQSTSDFAQFCFIRNDRIEVYPIPSSANTATITYEAFSRPFTQDDYTTGTITTLANASTAVVGSGSTWTAGMAGRYFRINDDGEWYKIATFLTATTLTLDTKYQGVAIAAGTDAYTIGQMPIIPEDTHEFPVFYALWKYFLFRKDVQLAREYKKAWNEGVKFAEANYSNLSSSGIVKSRPGLIGRGLVNPNYWPEGMS